jgi:ankyrin repeat protein
MTMTTRSALSRKLPCLLVGLLLAVVSAGAADIFRAAYDGDTATVERILQDNPGMIEARALDGRRPLHFAVSSGSKAMVELLLGRGAVVDATDIFGITPLHVAAATGRTEVASVLLSRGASVNVKHRYGKTPLGAALASNARRLIALLVQHGGRE